MELLQLKRLFTHLGFATKANEGVQERDIEVGNKEIDVIWHGYIVESDGT